MIQIDTGDAVFHKPTREMWQVAYVQGDRLAWCGWPDGTARVRDCLLVEKATAPERHELLVEMARGRGHRAEYARRALDAAQAA